MTIYAEYFIPGVMTGKLINALGDRGTIIIDGRHSLETIHDIAIETGKARKYNAYRILRGTGLLTALAVTPIINI